MERKARCVWVEGLHFDTYSHNGKLVRLDGWKDHELEEAGPTPGELIPMSLGTCTAMDVMFILRKARQQVTDCKIEMQAERAETVPKVFTKVHLHYVVSGDGMDEKQVKRAVELSAEKYCSVSHMLKATVEITHDYEIRESE